MNIKFVNGKEKILKIQLKLIQLKKHKNKALKTQTNVTATKDKEKNLQNDLFAEIKTVKKILEEEIDLFEAREIISFLSQFNYDSAIQYFDGRLKIKNNKIDYLNVVLKDDFQDSKFNESIDMRELIIELEDDVLKMKNNEVKSKYN